MKYIYQILNNSKINLKFSYNSCTSGWDKFAVIGKVWRRWARGKILSIKSCWKASSTPSEDGYIFLETFIRQVNVSAKLNFSIATFCALYLKERKNCSKMKIWMFDHKVWIFSYTFSPNPPSSCCFSSTN